MTQMVKIEMAGTEQVIPMEWAKWLLDLAGIIDGYKAEHGEEWVKAALNES